jgi:hypothetical protein
MGTETTERRPAEGRLIILTEGAFTEENILVSPEDPVAATVIEFPMLPDSLEISRSADYQVTNNRMLPDGIHIYEKTKPLEIQISFKLYAMDPYYCKKGALTLLEYAAKLQSIVLPIKADKTSNTLEMAEIKPPENTENNPAITAPLKPPKNTENNLENSGQKNENLQVRFKNGGFAYPPAVCFLHLMSAGDGQPGIRGIGYVSNVRTRFNGPWLKGPNGSYNLPTSAEYDFTFVNNPGYTNLLGFSSAGLSSTTTFENPLLIQGFANDVSKDLYNTYLLLKKSGVSYNVKGITNSK